MSEITIHKHFNYALGRYYKMLYDGGLLRNEINTRKSYHKVIMGELLSMQHTLFKNHMAERYFDGLKWDISKMTSKELLNRWYTFLYDTTIKAGYDEFFEVEDAYRDYNKYVKSDMPEMVKNIDTDLISRIDKMKYLVVEEIIDVFHFFLQLITIREEHKLALNMKFTPNTFKDIIVSPSNKQLLDSTINILKEEPNNINISFLYEEDFSVTSSENFILNFNRQNRNFMRSIMWKPWKNYKEDHFNNKQFETMTSQSRKMYSYLLKIFIFITEVLSPGLNVIESKEFVDVLNLDSLIVHDEIGADNCSQTNSIKSLEDKIRNDPYFKTITMLYIVYMSKNYENIQRQENGY